MTLGTIVRLLAAGPDIAMSGRINSSVLCPLIWGVLQRTVA